MAKNKFEPTLKNYNRPQQHQDRQESSIRHHNENVAGVSKWVADTSARHVPKLCPFCTVGKVDRHTGTCQQCNTTVPMPTKRKRKAV